MWPLAGGVPTVGFVCYQVGQGIVNGNGVGCVSTQASLAVHACGLFL